MRARLFVLAWRQLLRDARAGEVGLGQPRGGLAQGRGIGIGHEGAHGLILDEGGVDGVEMMVAHRMGGGGEGEEIVDRGGNLERALVTMAHDAGDPFGDGDARADDAADLILQGADHRPTWARRWRL